MHNHNLLKIQKNYLNNLHNKRYQNLLLNIISGTNQNKDLIDSNNMMIINS